MVPCREAPSEMETGMRSARGATMLIVMFGAIGPALAQNKKAEALNDEGKELYSDKKDFEGAAAKFRQAIAVSPDPRYYFNLCSALDRLELYDQAIEACDGVFAHKPRPELAQKTSAKAEDIRQKMKQRTAEPEAKPPEPPPVTEPDRTAEPPPIKPRDPALPPPAPANPYRGVYDSSVQRDSSSYGWALGGGVVGMRNNYKDSGYKDAGFGLMIFADLPVVRNLHMGIKPYVQFSNFQNQPNEGQGKPLSIFDVGAAWLWHIRLGSSNFYF